MIIAVCVLAHMGLSTLANICWKISAGYRVLKKFIIWQIGGHLSGFAGVLIYTFLLKLLPMGRVFPVIQGLSVLAVQVLAACWFFKEQISLYKWIGTLFIILGIMLISIS